jgi:amino acid transporter
MSASAPAPDEDRGTGLRRELRFWEAIARSIAIMAPTAAMALNGTVPAQLIGRAVPLAFIFATVGVVFVSYAFIRLSAHFSHAGSVYAFSGATLGPHAGFFSGWALLGTYLAFTAASTAEAGLFGVAFFQRVRDRHRARVVRNGAGARTSVMWHPRGTPRTFAPRATAHAAGRT